MLLSFALTTICHCARDLREGLRIELSSTL
ncbi:hypothetical protein ACFX15_002546 [Malus domestica]